jgi:hypothetical protein
MTSPTRMAILIGLGAGKVRDVVAPPTATHIVGGETD